MLKLLDILLFYTHVVVILVNLFGWIWVRTRKIHLMVMSLTLISWLVLGIRYGLGYCFLTDWEWGIKRKLGETDLPNSFIAYLTNHVFNMGLDPSLVDTITASAFILAVLVTVYVNFMK